MTGKITIFRQSIRSELFPATDRSPSHLCRLNIPDSFDPEKLLARALHSTMQSENRKAGF